MLVLHLVDSPSVFTSPSCWFTFSICCLYSIVLSPDSAEILLLMSLYSSSTCSPSLWNSSDFIRVPGSRGHRLEPSVVLYSLSYCSGFLRSYSYSLLIWRPLCGVSMVHMKHHMLPPLQRFSLSRWSLLLFMFISIHLFNYFVSILSHVHRFSLSVLKCFYFGYLLSLRLRREFTYLT